ncbi:MAG: hypothetical protein KDA58_01275 [Planctomycetaceae bacterium]|nr:hypothetical protein [Planctomycetaceae bacterium]
MPITARKNGFVLLVAALAAQWGLPHAIAQSPYPQTYGQVPYYPPGQWAPPGGQYCPPNAPPTLTPVPMPQGHVPPQPQQGQPQQGPSTPSQPAQPTPNSANAQQQPQQPQNQPNYQDFLDQSQFDNSALADSMQRGGGSDGYLGQYAPNMIGDFLGAGPAKIYSVTPGGGPTPINFAPGYATYEGIGLGSTIITPYDQTPAGRMQFAIDGVQGANGFQVFFPFVVATANEIGEPPQPGQPPQLTNVYQFPTLDPNGYYLTSGVQGSVAAAVEPNTLANQSGLQAQIAALLAATTAAGVSGTLTQTSPHTADLVDTVATPISAAQVPEYTDLNNNGVPDFGEEFADFNQNGMPDVGEFVDVDNNNIFDPFIDQPFDFNGNGLIDAGYEYVITPITEFTPGAYTFTQPAVTITLPQTPGALVGRQKIGENGSPRPKTRVFLNYSYFDNVAWRDGDHVNRYVPGVEKTFFHDQASLEVRFPFAASLNSEFSTGSISDGNQTEMGDLTAYFKYVLYDDGDALISAGTGVSLPTANNIEVIDAGTGRDFMEISNESIHLMPFLGLLWEPHHTRWFFQSFMQADFDLTGNAVSVTGFENVNVQYQAGGQNFNAQFTRPNGVLNQVGRINDPDRIYMDASLGFWIYPSFGFIKQIAPIFEMHYNMDLDNYDTISGPGIVCLNDSSQRSTLNGTVGLTAVLSPTMSATAGYTFPFLSGRQQEFDGEFRAFFNWYFPQGFRGGAM